MTEQRGVLSRRAGAFTVSGKASDLMMGPSRGPLRLLQPSGADRTHHAHSPEASFLFLLQSFSVIPNRSTSTGFIFCFESMLADYQEQNPEFIAPEVLSSATYVSVHFVC